MPDLTPAQHRAKALRFEEQALWSDAATAWRDTLNAMGSADGPVTSALRAEFQTRLRSAEARSGQALDTVKPVFEVEAHAEMKDKEGAERDPGGVTHLEAGKTESDTGAR